MISPNQLTKENGFEDGVVVEIVDTNLRKSIHYFRSVDDADGLPFITLNDWNPALIIVDSIRPLTGPMAVWNFAPEWADVLLTSGQGLYRFFTNEEWSKWSAMMFDGEHDTLSPRPFWAPKKA